MNFFYFQSEVFIICNKHLIVFTDDRSWKYTARELWLRWFHPSNSDGSRLNIPILAGNVLHMIGQ